MIEVKSEVNQKKYELYKQMLCNLNVSINNGFYLQAVFIEYAMLEDRCSSIIRVTLGEKTLETNGLKWKGLDKKIEKIKNYVNNNTNDALIKKYLNDEILNKILEWKDIRNKMVHTLMIQFDAIDLKEDLKEIAIKGREIVREFKDIANKVKNRQKVLNAKKNKK